METTVQLGALVEQATLVRFAVQVRPRVISDRPFCLLFLWLILKLSLQRPRFLPRVLQGVWFHQTLKIILGQTC